MSTIYGRSTAELQEELRKTVKYYEDCLYFETDRLRVYAHQDMTTQEGSIVGLLAFRGKIELIMRHLSSSGSELDRSLKLHFDSLIQSWSEYIEDFRTETTSKLSEHYKTFILRFYEGPGDSWEILFEPGDLGWFQAQRDSIECFLLGSDIEWPEKDFRGPLIEPDSKLKDFVKTSVVPHILKKSAPSVVADGNIDWLPESFWWRHL
ncbi:MAG: hypothetical protein IID34_06430 [Planctomycetes bacterium]|nr:hypothetical protein [Planctomycetota bacterium]